MPQHYTDTAYHISYEVLEKMAKMAGRTKPPRRTHIADLDNVLEKKIKLEDTPIDISQLYNDFCDVCWNGTKEEICDCIDFLGFQLTDKGHDPLILICKRRDFKDLVKFFIERYKIDVNDRNGQLLSRLRYEDIEIVDYLVKECGCDTKPLYEKEYQPKEIKQYIENNFTLPVKEPRPSRPSRRSYKNLILDYVDDSAKN